MNPASRTCAICDAALPPGARPKPVCDQLRCRWQYDSTPPSRLCESCGRLLASREVGGRWCARLECQQARVRWQSEEARRKRHELEERGRQFRDRVAEAAGVSDPRSYPLMLVPSITAPLTPVPEYRRADMAEHLAAVFAEAMVPVEGEEPPPPEPPTADRADPVLVRGCATCRGHCCRLGGVNHAFLTVASIRRVLRTFPERTPEDLIQGYLDAIGESLDGSCVYHGPMGCVLPRDLRGNMCNTYFCAPLLAFRDQLSADGPVQAFVLSVEEGVRGEFTDGTEHRPLPAEVPWGGGEPGA
jgi:hypothetical protein